jgi:hypothetical protein
LKNHRYVIVEKAEHEAAEQVKAAGLPSPSVGWPPAPADTDPSETEKIVEAR